MDHSAIESSADAAASSPCTSILDPPAAVSCDQTIRATQESLRRLEWRDWSLWLGAVVVMLVLAFGMYSFTLLPAKFGVPHSDLERFNLGLFGLLLVFAVFAFHRQTLVNRLRRELAGQMNLAAALQARSELFQKLAILDPLTGLYNRRFAMQHLPVEIARCSRYEYKLTVLMFDINGLKQINDQHSHLAGDLALRTFAAALRRAIRSSDVGIRMGGDEFLAVLAECEEVGVPRVLARMRNLHCNFRGQEIPIIFSAGWAEYLAGETAEELLARADQRLCEDKRTDNASQQARAIQEQLHQSVKMEVMGRLTSGVAHDFNNLLTIIKGAAELGSHALDPSHPAYPQIEQIEHAAERAANLTRQLLAFSRKQVLEPKNVDLGVVVSAMQMILQRLLGKAIELSLEISPGLYEIRIDPGQLEQVIINLIANAHDAMPKGGRVAIEVANCELGDDFLASHPGARCGEYVCLSVRDSGAGMDANTQKRVFEPFFTTKEPGKGVGLGLSIVYGVVKQSGGYIWVSSEPGKGTCVSVYLRRNVAPNSLLSQPASMAAPASRRSKRPPVLVVESFDGLRQLMCNFLELTGYRPVPAANSEQAIQIMNEETDIELLVCDLVLPGMSGLELSQCLGEHRNLQVLYVSGYAEDTLMHREYLRDTAHVLSAPFNAEDLSQKLRMLAANRTAVGAQVHQIQ